jgi:hypothetical protein
MHAPYADVTIDVERVGKYYEDKDITYVVWSPNGDVARVAYGDDGWEWTYPFETMDFEHKKSVVDVCGSKGGQKISVQINPSRFREGTGKIPIPPDVAAYDYMGKQLESGCMYRSSSLISKESKNKKSRIVLSSDGDHPIAFGVHAFARIARSDEDQLIQMRGSKDRTPNLSYQWISACVVPWKFIHDYKTTLMEMFMWSDKRFQTEHDKYKERLIISRDDHGVIARELNAEGIEMLGSYVDRIAREYTTREFQVMYEHHLPPNLLKTYGEEQDDVRLSTFNTHLEGLPYHVTDVKLSDGSSLPDAYLGASAQAWYVYSKPVVTEEWILQKLKQVSALWSYDVSSYVDDVNDLISDTEWTDDPHYKKMLTDVIRIATMNATSSPYTEDKRRFSNGTSKDSDTYTCALTAPGDCEDGAHSAYMIYMSILFGSNWKNPQVKALQKLAAYLGMPICITGTASNPMRPVNKSQGGTHAYGAVIPYRKFIQALFRDNEAAIRKALDLFRSRFGFEAPDKMDASSIETTLFSSPLVDHHASHPLDQSAAYDIVKNMMQREFGETHCAWRNLSYTHLLDDKTAVHLLAFKAYTSAHREMFYSSNESFDWYPQTIDGRDAGKHSCTFTFLRADGNVGIQRSELYLYKYMNVWTFAVPYAMSEELFDIDMKLVENTRQPYVPLCERVYDPQKSRKSNEANAQACVALYEHFDYSRPHVLIFVYDITIDDTIEKLNALREKISQSVGKRVDATFVPYDKCISILMYW